MIPVQKRSYPKDNGENDMVVCEQALTVDVVYGKAHHRKISRLATTMRTPGHDEALIIGLLFSLGIIDSPSEIVALLPCMRSKLEGLAADHVTVELHHDRRFSPYDFQFGHVRSSSCGVCGSVALPPVCAAVDRGSAPVLAQVLCSLPKKMAAQQRIFQKTGGCHAAALFDRTGDSMAIYEDIGRHNALDKLIGSMLRSCADHWQTGIVVLSSRAGFEIMQKALRAGFTTVAVMGAVSDMAVSIAEAQGLTLVGFLRDDRLNVYTHPFRIVFE